MVPRSRRDGAAASTSEVRVLSLLLVPGAVASTESEQPTPCVGLQIAVVQSSLTSSSSGAVPSLGLGWQPHPQPHPVLDETRSSEVPQGLWFVAGKQSACDPEDRQGVVWVSPLR